MRLCAFFQLLTVNSLLFACERSQILLLTTGNQNASSQSINITMNTILIIPSFVLAIYYPQVGSIAGLAGAFGTMLCIYFLPIFTYMKYWWTKITDKEEINKIMDSNESAQTLITQIRQLQQQRDSQKNKWYLFSIVSFFICSYGVLVFVLNVLSFVNG